MHDVCLWNSVIRRMTLERLNNEKMVSYCILFYLFDVLHESG